MEFSTIFLIFSNCLPFHYPLCKSTTRSVYQKSTQLPLPIVPTRSLPRSLPLPIVQVSHCASLLLEVSTKSLPFICYQESTSMEFSTIFLIFRILIVYHFTTTRSLQFHLLPGVYQHGIFYHLLNLQESSTIPLPIVQVYQQKCLPEVYHSLATKSLPACNFLPGVYQSTTIAQGVCITII